MVVIHDRWSHLPEPFKPGVTLPHVKGWTFSFRDAKDRLHVNDDAPSTSATEAKAKMRQFCIDHGNIELAKEMEKRK